MAKRIIKEMLDKYSKINPARYHMPGHKGKINPHDVTEVSFTDNLNNPETFFLDAQRALSKSYSSAKSFFMVNGSTGAIHSMLKYISLVGEGQILISRNCHKSILSACMLFDIDAMFIEDDFDKENQLFVFDENKIIDAVKNNENLSAVVITPVDYYGRVINLDNISKICKQKNVLLLCDEAHGAHFNISNKLPDSALKYADICVHSPHKTLSAFTQCAYVHIANSIDVDKFESIIYSLQTSSPSFLLAKSMDDARYYSNTMCAEWEKRIASSKRLSTRINEIKGLQTKDIEWAKSTGYDDKDSTRLVIDVSNVGNGIEIGKILENEYSIFMEMYSFKYIVGILTPWDDEQWDERLYSALLEIAKQKQNNISLDNFPNKNIRIISIADAAKSVWEKVAFADAANRTAAVSIGVYPPGVPLVLPGEIISEQTLKYMQQVESLGGSLFGVSSGYINCIKQKNKRNVPD